ncbi:precorrin-3B synthase [Bradyrhizobium sp. SRS-191]|uniref:precorrin-3B synthase n=1 Tax=Bradyrhizobium sp. SRS-191 TaxID=2962606 RepID=UPI00211E49DF|nr:precorrin-3B synthase [Bradyrhizobium sp. SRS-191]
MTAGIEIKGWCPGARRPMQSGDGLIVRVRPHSGALSVSALRELAAAARRFGNGEIDLTRRANLQIRGVRAETLTPLWDLMASLGVLDDSAELEAIRNIVINPLAGLDPAELTDMRPVAAALEALLGSDDALQALPAKFGFALDGGGRLPLRNLAADIRLVACGSADDPHIAVGLTGPDGVEWLGSTALADAAPVAAKLARTVLQHSPTRRSAMLPPHAITIVAVELGLDARETIASGAASPRLGRLPLAGDSNAVGLGIPFGRIDSETLEQLTELLASLDVSEVRLSPWRALYVAAESDSAAALVADAARLGLIVDDTDPLMRIDACSGVGCCTSTALATREHARVLAAAMVRTGFAGALHVSGCAKGCARSASADVVLVGEGDHYNIVRNGTVKNEACDVIGPADLAAAADGLFKSREKAHV